MDGRERASIKEETGKRCARQAKRERLGLVALESFQILSLSVFLQQCKAKYMCWDYFSLDRWSEVRKLHCTSFYQLHTS